MNEDFDFLLEKRLRELNRDLHKRFTDTVFIAQHILPKFQRIFPEFTDHSVFHSMNVLIFCNQLIGADQIEEMNEYDIFVLLMCCYLHDTGMAVTERDYEEFKTILGAEEYFRQNPGKGIPDFIREKHHEFSGLYIRKYADLLEIPSQKLTYAISQVAKGHRRTNLFDTENYPEELEIADGKMVHLPYLSALVRLADEIDVIADRNPMLLYDIESLTDQQQVAHHRLLKAVPEMKILPEGFLLDVRTEDEMLYIAVEALRDKMQATLDLCRAVIHQRTPFHLSQEWIRLQRI